jgi:hypothetical protein
MGSKKKSGTTVSKPRRSGLRARLRHPGEDVRSGAAGTASAVTTAAVRAYQRGLDRVLTTSDRVTSAAEGREVLASDEHPEILSDQMQKVAVAAVPVMRLARRSGRFSKVPPVFLASTALSAGMTVRRGVRELQVVAALLEYRIEEATGEPADSALVKALAAALYLDPKRVPEPSRGSLHLAPLGRRWAWRGALGRDTGAAADRALEAAERLDVAAQAARWNAAAASANHR